MTIKNKTFSRDCNPNTQRSDCPLSYTSDLTLIDGRPTAHGQTHHYGPQLREALHRLEILIVDGLQHGFFQYCITCKIVHGGKRELVVRAGKSDKFTIPDNELPH